MHFSIKSQTKLSRHSWMDQHASVAKFVNFYVLWKSGILAIENLCNDWHRITFLELTLKIIDNGMSIFYIDGTSKKMIHTFIRLTMESQNMVKL